RRVGRPRCRIVDFVGEYRAAQRVGADWRRGNSKVGIEARATPWRDRREIAVAIRGERQRIIGRQPRCLAEFLEAEKEEAPIPSVVDFRNADRAADSAAEIVTALPVPDLRARSVV